MTPEQQKEELSKAYVAAVAARCGYALGSWSQDQGGLDVSIGAASPVGRGHLAGPQIDIQLKCTSDQGKVKRAHVSWQFKTASKHNTLVHPRLNPLFLVIMVLPADTERWFAHSQDELIMRRCAYYKLMTGEELTEVAAPTIQVPQSDIFSPEALTRLMERRSQGEWR